MFESEAAFISLYACKNSLQVALWQLAANRLAKLLNNNDAAFQWNTITVYKVVVSFTARAITIVKNELLKRIDLSNTLYIVK